MFLKFYSLLLLKMSPQSWVVAVVYGILLVVSMILLITKNAFNAFTTISFLFSIIQAAILVYDTNCLTTGACGVWSWIRTALYCVVPVIIYIMFIFGKQEEEQKQA